MAFQFWGFMYDILGIALIVVVAIFFYRIYIASKIKQDGISRT